MMLSLLAALALAPVKKVLIIGIDGLMPVALQAAKTPAFDALIANGCVSYAAQTGDVTVSGPGWSSMLTGVWREKHGVDDNAFKTKHYDRYPHFFRRVKEFDPKLRTASIVAWDPINDQILSDCDLALKPGSDELVARVAAEVLENQDVDVLFVHLDVCDGAGHAKGYGPAATALAHLGVPLKPEWNLDGQPRGLAGSANLPIYPHE